MQRQCVAGPLQNPAFNRVVLILETRCPSVAAAVRQLSAEFAQQQAVDVPADHARATRFLRGFTGQLEIGRLRVGCIERAYVRWAVAPAAGLPQRRLHAGK